MSQRIRVNKCTVAWWLKYFGFTISRWDVCTKYGIACLTVGYYDVRDWQSAHVFFF